MNHYLGVVLLLSSAILPGCGAPPAETPAAAVPIANDAPVWEIGEDIAGKKVMIDGKEVLIPDDLAESKRKMDAAAKESLDAMDALEKKRLERFNDPDMKP